MNKNLTSEQSKTSRNLCLCNEIKVVLKIIYIWGSRTNVYIGLVILCWEWVGMKGYRPVDTVPYPLPVLQAYFRIPYTPPHQHPKSSVLA